jgi:hypothetical protein
MTKKEQDEKLPRPAVPRRGPDAGNLHKFAFFTIFMLWGESRRYAFQKDPKLKIPRKNRRYQNNH